jgi:hypothetical protein
LGKHVHNTAREPDSELSGDRSKQSANQLPYRMAFEFDRSNLTEILVCEACAGLVPLDTSMLSGYGFELLQTAAAT